MISAAQQVATTMILRISQKLNGKIDAGRLSEMPLDENPYADWSSHLFTADRTHYIILTNTPSLYSTLMYARGITNDAAFIERALSTIREFMEYDGLSFIYQRFIAPSSATVSFAKALNRAVTGSINDLVHHAKMWLTEGELSPHDVGFKLNEMPLSLSGKTRGNWIPRAAFKELSREDQP